MTTGKVLVFAQWKTRELIGNSPYDVQHVWFVPFEVKRGANNKLDLSGSNEGVFWRR